MQFRFSHLHSISRVVGYAYVYVLLEWLFFATKPSFLTTNPFPAQLRALFLGALPFIAVSLLLHGLSLVLAWADARMNQGTSPRLARMAPHLVPAAVTALIALMLFDNFTYTVFGWGVFMARWTRPLYLAGFLAVFALHLKSALRSEGPVRREESWSLVASVGLLLLGSVIALPFTRPEMPPEPDPSPDDHRALPNIVMFASDGVTASLTSAYGYRRKTTPNLDRFLDRALVVDNAFTNSRWTTGSLTSMLSGKYPATTKLLYRPYVLQGDDAYETLPRLLRRMGYRSHQESIRYYADGPDLNWREAFDSANGRNVETANEVLFRKALQLPSLFTSRMTNRLTDRLGHVLLLRTMMNPHAAVTSPELARVYGVSDGQRLKRVFSFIDQASGPFFIHIHLMGTHCCRFAPMRQTFSAGVFASNEERDAAALDDTILESDAYFGALMAHLEQRNLLENTIVVYSSDHTSGWGFKQQVPLIFLFPHGAHRGHLRPTAQLLDVAPTLLDYLGAPIPAWMEGSSLLGSALGATRPVFTISGIALSQFQRRRDVLFQVSMGSEGPPTYGLTDTGMVVCQRWYDLQLQDRKITTGAIPSYRGGCPEASLPSEEQAREMISEHLRRRGISF